MGDEAGATLGLLVTTSFSKASTGAPMHFLFFVQGLHHLSFSSKPNFALHFLDIVGAGNETGEVEARAMGVGTVFCKYERKVGKGGPPNAGEVGRARGDVAVVKR